MNAAAIAILVEKGLTAADILAVAEALETRKDRTGAERQARYRERNKVTRDVTRDENPSPLTPPLKSPPDPQKITPPISPHPSVISRAKNSPPDGVSDEQWSAFLRLRTAKRQPMTERGYSLLCGKLRTIAEHGWPPGEMIDLAIERGWTTVHEPKEHRNGHMGRNQPAADGRSATTRAADWVFGTGSELHVQERADSLPRLGGPFGNGRGGPP